METLAGERKVLGTIINKKDKKNPQGGIYTARPEWSWGWPEGTDSGEPHK